MEKERDETEKEKGKEKKNFSIGEEGDRERG